MSASQPPTVATRWNLDALEEYYTRWKADPASVDASWRTFFEGYELGLASSALPDQAEAGGGAAARLEQQQAHAQAGIVRLVDAYRRLGHFLAHLDPLSPPPVFFPLLELPEFGLSDADLDTEFDTSNLQGPRRARLRDILANLKATYCRTIGVEYMHIQDTGIRVWLQERMERTRNRPDMPRRRKLRLLMKLHHAEMFERFLHTRFPGQKRFSLEGAETLIPILDALVEQAPDVGVHEIVMGMTHRGRLNVLANILQKPYELLFAEFEGSVLPGSVAGDGDVKYHLGFSCDYVNARERKVHLSLTPNPSHLEAVDAVVEGRVRCRQWQQSDKDRVHAMPLLMHGDAAFAGQGMVAETLNLSQLSGYRTGGTIHIIVNNQIGFTTSPSDARSTTYCTDIAKMLEVPIFHVNGEDPEACVYVAELALEFRQQFHKDVVIDMFCYRRHGHNEGDDPSFTQPLLYRNIKDRPTLREVYTEQLIIRGDLTAQETDAIAEAFQTKAQRAHDEVKTDGKHFKPQASFAGRWEGMQPAYSHSPVETAAKLADLETITDKLVQMPDGFHVHPKILRIFENRQKTLREKRLVDWAGAELLAFGSLLLEGYPIRLSGQDSRRGTFSQRHSVLYDTETGTPYVPLNHLAERQGEFAAYDSLLSEAAVLAFEYGMALDEPMLLTLWEAQFGDFVNGAQVIIDQFIAAGESKWQRANGIVLLLPHAYEGQGPEHSSARPERFLQLCAEDNMQVVNLTTPAQYFHVLRRQLKRDFRKPLVVMTPKSLLRHKDCVSRVESLAEDRFHEILDDAKFGTKEASAVRRVLLCSGKVFYDLLDHREKHQAKDVAILRVEQFYPFPEEQLKRVLQHHRRATDFVWVQEESQNMGGWSFMEPRLRQLLDRPIEYVGRDASASPATGSLKVHKREQEELVAAAIGGAVPHIVQSTPIKNDSYVNGDARTAPAPPKDVAATKN
jgi:2-oxoglutarate dehydrogenase E1 component